IPRQYLPGRYQLRVRGCTRGREVLSAALPEIEKPRQTGAFLFRGAETSGPRHTTLRCRRSAISSLPKPNALSTSSVCSPNSGGRAAILLGVRDSLKGWLTS